MQKLNRHRDLASRTTMKNIMAKMEGATSRERDTIGVFLLVCFDRAGITSEIQMTGRRTSIGNAETSTKKNM